MKNFFKIALLIILMGIGCQAVAQNQDDVQFEEIDTILNKVILKKEITGGIMLYTRGFGIIFRKGFNENFSEKCQCPRQGPFRRSGRSADGAPA